MNEVEKHFIETHLKDVPTDCLEESIETTLMFDTPIIEGKKEKRLGLFIKKHLDGTCFIELSIDNRTVYSSESEVKKEC